MHAKGALDVVHDLLLGRLAFAEPFEALHDFEFNVLKGGAALVERGDVALQGHEVLGQAGAAVEPRFVPFDPGGHLLNVRFRALEFGFGVVDGHFCGSEFAVGHGERSFKVADPGIAFDGPAAVGQGLEPGVESLQFEQFQLFRRCCLGHYYLRLFLPAEPGTDRRRL